MIHFWDTADYVELERATSFSELVSIAMRVIRRMPAPVGMVCGPISTGGKGSLEANMHVLSTAVDLAYTKGASILDQKPFEDKLQQLRKTYATGGHQELLDDFWWPILSSGLVSFAYFLPDWQSSKGATWEREQYQKLGLEIKEYPLEWLKEIEGGSQS